VQLYESVFSVGGNRLVLEMFLRPSGFETRYDLGVAIKTPGDAFLKIGAMHIQRALKYPISNSTSLSLLKKPFENNDLNFNCFLAVKS